MQHTTTISNYCCVIYKRFYLSFTAVFHMPTDNCDITQLVGVYNVEISSHEEATTKAYRSNYDCSLHLSVSSSHLVNVTFTHFDLQPPVDGVCVDYVQFFLGRGHEIPLTEPLCGPITPRTIVSNTSDVTMRFRSDALLERTGFKFHYSRVKLAHAQSLGIIADLGSQVGTYQKPSVPTTTSGSPTIAGTSSKSILVLMSK